jgi:hypothetical protein
MSYLERVTSATEEFPGYGEILGRYFDRPPKALGSTVEIILFPTDGGPPSKHPFECRDYHDIPKFQAGVFSYILVDAFPINPNVIKALGYRFNVDPMIFCHLLSRASPQFRSKQLIPHGERPKRFFQYGDIGIQFVEEATGMEAGPIETVSLLNVDCF